MQQPASTVVLSCDMLCLNKILLMLYNGLFPDEVIFEARVIMIRCSTWLEKLKRLGRVKGGSRIHMLMSGPDLVRLLPDQVPTLFRRKSGTPHTHPCPGMMSLVTASKVKLDPCLMYSRIRTTRIEAQLHSYSRTCCHFHDHKGQSPEWLTICCRRSLACHAYIANIVLASCVASKCSPLNETFAASLPLIRLYVNIKSHCSHAAC